MESPSSINALIKLLDDPDAEVYDVVSDALIQNGLGILPALEAAWETSRLELVQRRIEDIISSIQFNDTTQQLQDWLDDGATQLLQGVFLVAKSHFPELEYDTIENKIKIIGHRIWLELSNERPALESVQAINRFIYGEYGYRIHPQLCPESHFINCVLQTKKASPIMLSLLYSIVAQTLNIPIYPVKLPKHIILAYRNMRAVDSQSPDAIYFYINPAHRGMAFSRLEVENALQSEGETCSLQPCSNAVAVRSLLRSLVFNLERLNQLAQVQRYRQMIDLIDQYLANKTRE